MSTAQKMSIVLDIKRTQGLTQSHDPDFLLRNEAGCVTIHNV